MSKTVSSTEVKNRFGSVVTWVLENKEEVIVENRGEPTIVIIPFSEYEKVQQLREQVRRQEAFARLEALREQVRMRNQDLSEEQAENLGDLFSREVVERMIKDGRIRYNRDAR